MGTVAAMAIPATGMEAGTAIPGTAIPAVGTLAGTSIPEMGMEAARGTTAMGAVRGTLEAAMVTPGTATLAKAMPAVRAPAAEAALQAVRATLEEMLREMLLAATLPVAALQQEELPAPRQRQLPAGLRRLRGRRTAWAKGPD